MRKSYPGPRSVLAGINLTLDEGVFGLLGPNGAGKSTFVEILAGNLMPSDGTARLDDGYDLTQEPDRWRSCLGYMPQGFDFPGQVTGRELLEYAGSLRGFSRRELRPRIDALLERVNLVDAADRYAAGYSRGMKQRLGIILALLPDPRLLLLDEPTSGLDPVERLFFRELLAEVGATRVVIVSTHIVGDIERCCSRVGVLARGGIVFDGTPAELAACARGRVWEHSSTEGEAPQPGPNRRLVALTTRGNESVARVISAEMPTPDSIRVEPGVADGYVALVEGAAADE